MHLERATMKSVGRMAASLIVTVAVAACAPVQYYPPAVYAPTVLPPTPYLVASEFDPAQARQLLQPGKNSIRGSALVRQGGGGVVTCAGGIVTLVPATLYADERMAGVAKIYREEGFSGVRDQKFDPDDAAYAQIVRQTTCDALGFFEFENVADGAFYVQTDVSWKVNYKTQGGFLMQRVSLKGGSKTTVVLSP